MNKIFDCITFFDENLQADLRFNILHDVVNYFVICESRYDHKNNLKKILFDKELVVCMGAGSISSWIKNISKKL